MIPAATIRSMLVRWVLSRISMNTPGPVCGAGPPATLCCGSSAAASWPRTASRPATSPIFAQPGCSESARMLIPSGSESLSFTVYPKTNSDVPEPDL